ncbi:MAG: glycosyltransferase [Sphingomonadales bacterium]|jgi:alpha-1,6-mannosyltransferase
MHIVDISALYSPKGGGIRTYTRRKLKIAERFGVRMTVVAPGVDDGVESFGEGRLISIKSPKFPLDRNYCYFANDGVIHRALDDLAPDFVECSSPWGSAAAVAEWPGQAPRALFMHAEPMSAWVYRHLDGFLSRRVIDRSFGWFWRYLQRLDAQYQLVVTAAPSVANRLRGGGLGHVVVHPMGVDPGVFSPDRRDEALRAGLLADCALPPDAVLALGVGRLSPEKQWPLVIAGVTAAAYGRALGLVLLGDGHGRAAVQRAIGDNPHVRLLQPVTGRDAYASVLASADLLVHGCAAETFGLACAEAAASGVPLVVPDEGGAFDQLVPGQGLSYRAGDAASLAGVLASSMPQLPALRAAATAAASNAFTMDEHFAGLFAAYRQQLLQPRAA